VSTANPTPDLADKVFVVTGATAGIGKAIARNLLQRGATVVVPVRDLQRAEAVRAELGGPGRFVAHQADLSVQAQVRAFAARVAQDHPVLAGVINNAGMWQSTRGATPDGIEVIWATNVLAPYLLTELLRERLAAGHGRIINIGSQANSGLDLDDVQFDRRGFSAIKSYSASKQAIRYLTWAQAGRYKAQGISAHCVDPGFVKTELNRSVSGFIAAFISTMQKLIADPPEKAADTPTWLAASSDAGIGTGKMWRARKEMPGQMSDQAQLDRLWSICEQMTSASGKN
jgi:NAD(P)-dependent dehydrogenase (short-subunit alcohol dehydrogenase family)